MENLDTLARAAVYILELEKKKDEKLFLIHNHTCPNKLITNFNSTAITWCGVNNYTKMPRNTIRKPRSIVPSTSSSEFFRTPGKDDPDTILCIKKERKISQELCVPSAAEKVKQKRPRRKKRKISQELCVPSAAEKVKQKRPRRKKGTNITCPRTRAKTYTKADPEELPVELEKRIIQKMGGGDVKCVIQKHTSVSDLNESLNRFSIPVTQVL